MWHVKCERQNSNVCIKINELVILSNNKYLFIYLRTFKYIFIAL